MIVCLERPQLGHSNQLKDRETFNGLYESYSAAIFGEIVRIIKHKETSEDLLQDIFLTIWQKRELFDPEKGSLFTWMITITRNKCIDHLRKNVNNMSFYPIENIREKLWEHKTELLEFSLLFKRLIKLSPQHMELVRLIYVYGYTHHEVSEKCQIPLGTVKTILRNFIRKTKANYSS